METAKTISGIRKIVASARADGKTVGLVPTMGALHKGHVSLIQRAVTDCGFTVVSIFVNPTQFGRGEDIKTYPRTREDDIDLCGKSGVDAVFIPDSAQMYPGENLCWVVVEKLTKPLCGKFRPGHFRGVATVCAKLFNIVAPDAAYFGQKDAQQALVVKKMVADLNMPLEIVVCPTVRESDGLAVSSRNRYLTPAQRLDAALLHDSLEACRRMLGSGTRNVRQLEKRMRDVLARGGGIQIEYAEVVDAETLESVAEARGRVIAAVAARIGAARLIDNLLLDAGD